MEQVRTLPSFKFSSFKNLVILVLLLAIAVPLGINLMPKNDVPTYTPETSKDFPSPFPPDKGAVKLIVGPLSFLLFGWRQLDDGRCRYQFSKYWPDWWNLWGFLQFLIRGPYAYENGPCTPEGVHKLMLQVITTGAGIVGINEVPQGLKVLSIWWVDFYNVVSK